MWCVVKQKMMNNLEFKVETAKEEERLKQYIGRSCRVICFYQKINNIGTFAFSATVFVFV